MAHIVKSYDEELQRLAQELGRMGEMAATQLESALDVVCLLYTSPSPRD